MAPKGPFSLAHSRRQFKKNPLSPVQGTVTISFKLSTTMTIISTHLDISNAFISYFSNIFGASHYPLLHANWNILCPNCEWSSGDIDGPFNEDELELQYLVLAPKKHRVRIDFVLYFFKDFRILLSQIFSYCSTTLLWCCGPPLSQVCFGCPYFKERGCFYG